MGGDDFLFSGIFLRTFRGVVDYVFQGLEGVDELFFRKFFLLLLHFLLFDVDVRYYYFLTIRDESGVDREIDGLSQLFIAIVGGVMRDTLTTLHFLVFSGEDRGL